MDDTSRQAVSKEQFYTAAVGKRAARYYVPKFLAFDEGAKLVSFNLWALLFGAFWFFYRRMWISALILWLGGVWLLGVLAATALVALGLPQYATPAVSIVTALYAGLILPLYANYLYYSSVGQRVTTLREKFTDDADALNALKSRSPVNWIALSVLAVVFLGLRLFQARLSQNEVSETAVRAAMEHNAAILTAIQDSYRSRHVWPEDLADLALDGELRLSAEDAQYVRVDLGTVTIRFTSPDNLRGGLLSLRPSLLGSGAVVWTCGYHTPLGVDVPKGGSGPDLTNIAPKYLPLECKKYFWDWD